MVPYHSVLVPHPSHLTYQEGRICQKHKGSFPATPYSQDLQAKKYAPIASSLIATWVSENLILASSRRTTAGRAFCCFFFGSSFLKDRRSLDRNLPSSPSLSLEGFGRLFSRKVCATCAMIFRTVLSTKVP